MQRFKNILYVASDFTSGTVLERAVALANNNQASLTVVVVIDTMPANASRLDRVRSIEALREEIAQEYYQELDDWLAPWVGKIEITSKVVIGIPLIEIVREVIGFERDLVIKPVACDDDRVLDDVDVPLLRKCPCPVWLVKHKTANDYRQILAAVDVGDFYLPKEAKSRYVLNRQILEMAISLALAESADLHIVQAWEAVGEDTLRGPAKASEKELEAHVEQIRQHYEQKLNSLIVEISNNIGHSTVDNVKPVAHLLKGTARDEIPAFARDIKPDIVIIGTVARTGISGFLVGNTAESILKQTDCSILAIKPPGFISSVN